MPPADADQMCDEDEQIFWDALDFIALAWSIHDFADEPSWRNALFVGADALGAALPVIPSLGTIRRGTKILSVAEAWSVYSMLRQATRTKGNYGMGSGSRKLSEIMGYAWVGFGHRLSTDGTTLISADNMRQYRPPAWKPSRSQFQSNFQWRSIEHSPWASNGHLTIVD
jgi:hypothetical protein